MTGRSAERIREVLSWQLAAGIVRLCPGRLQVVETHPGGGMYDCLSLRPRAGDPAPIIDLNRVGSAHVHLGDDFRSWGSVWSIVARPGGLEEMALRLVLAADLSPVGVTDAGLTGEDLAVEIISRLMGLCAGAQGRWECRNGYLDSSDGCGVRRALFEAFPDAIRRLGVHEPSDLLGEPAYRFWFVLRDGAPVACVEGPAATAWDLRGGFWNFEGLAGTESIEVTAASLYRATEMPLRVRIHRGAAEIGGNCVELEAGGSRIVLDVGRPLSSAFGEVVPLPDVRGFSEEDPSLLGVIISHPHRDHWGLAPQLPDAVPVYIGEAAASILREALFFTTGVDLKPAGVLEHRKPFVLGPFRITPYLNDHSGFDAYSLLVEAGGRRLFYSGDIQGHGRKRRIFEQLLRSPPKDVDVLLMEGTHVRPAGEATTARAHTEADVEERCVETMRVAEGLVLAIYSAQNIDRLVTLYRAAKRSGRTLLLDLYGATIAAATGNPNIPHPDPEWPGVKVYVPQRQRIQVKEAAAFERVAAVKPFRIYADDICAAPGKFVLTMRGSMTLDLERMNCLQGAVAIWSLWSGYRASSKRLLEYLESRSVPVVEHHASGHAHVEDLQRLAKGVAAGRIVPIHSGAPERFGELFEGVEVHQDGEWWAV